MVIERKLYTAEEFLTMELDDEDERVYELVEGKLVSMPRPSTLHGIIQGLIAAAIIMFSKEHDLGYVTVESGYVLERNPDTVRGPDVAYIRRDRFQGGRTFIAGGPDLAVEVVSPSDSAEKILAKVQGYLAAGTEIVWVAYPSARVIIVFTANGDRRYGPDDILDGGDVLPGFSVRVGDLFPA